MSYFKNNFLHAMTVLDYLPKWKKGLGLTFGAHFLHEFSIKLFELALSIDNLYVTQLNMS